MKPWQAIFLAIGIIVLAWASLFITVLNQSNQTHQLIRNDHVLLSQDTAILNAQKKTEADLEHKIDLLQGHVDCLFNLATQPNHAYIADAQACTIATPGTTSAAALGAPQQPSKVFVSSSPANSNPSNAPAQPNNAQSAKSLTCELTLGLLGC